MPSLAFRVDRNPRQPHSESCARDQSSNHLSGYRDRNPGHMTFIIHDDDACDHLAWRLPFDSGEEDQVPQQDENVLGRGV